MARTFGGSREETKKVESVGEHHVGLVEILGQTPAESMVAYASGTEMTTTNNSKLLPCLRPCSGVDTAFIFSVARCSTFFGA